MPAGRPDRRYRQLIRCLRLVKDPRTRQLLTCDVLATLAASHGVCTRTIRRDLQALREAGYLFVAYTEVDIPGAPRQKEG